MNTTNPSEDAMIGTSAGWEGNPAGEPVATSQENTEMADEKSTRRSFGRAFVALENPEPVDFLPKKSYSRGEDDLVPLFDVLAEAEDQWYLIAKDVPNPGRFYEGMRKIAEANGRVAETRSRGTGNEIEYDGEVHDTYDVYSRILSDETAQAQALAKAERRARQEATEDSNSGRRDRARKDAAEDSGDSE